MDISYYNMYPKNVLYIMHLKVNKLSFFSVFENKRIGMCMYLSIVPRIII